MLSPYCFTMGMVCLSLLIVFTKTQCFVHVGKMFNFDLVDMSVHMVAVSLTGPTGWNRISLGDKNPVILFPASCRSPLLVTTPLHVTLSCDWPKFCGCVCLCCKALGPQTSDYHEAGFSVRDQEGQLLGATVRGCEEVDSSVQLFQANPQRLIRGKKKTSCMETAQTLCREEAKKCGTFHMTVLWRPSRTVENNSCILQTPWHIPQWEGLHRVLCLVDFEGHVPKWPFRNHATTFLLFDLTILGPMHGS